MASGGVAWLVLALGFGAGCGGGGGGSGIPPSTPLGRLSMDEAGRLCDAINDVQGGYGRSVQCPARTETTSPSHDGCVSFISAAAALCPSLTAGDLEGCTDAIGTDLCKFDTAPACANARACGIQ